jgi:hypothetical protein
VRFNMVLDRMFRVLCRVDRVTVRQMCMVGGFFVIARFVMCGRFVVVARSVFVMLGCLLVMIGCFLGHIQPPDDLKTGLLQPRGIIVRPRYGWG